MYIGTNFYMSEAHMVSWFDQIWSNPSKTQVLKPAINKKPEIWLTQLKQDSAMIVGPTNHPYVEQTAKIWSYLDK